MTSRWFLHLVMCLFKADSLNSKLSVRGILGIPVAGEKKTAGDKRPRLLQGFRIDQGQAQGDPEGIIVQSKGQVIQNAVGRHAGADEQQQVVLML